MKTDIHKQEIKKIYKRLKSSAEKRGIDFDLSISDLEDLGFPISCPVLGIPIYFNRGSAADDSISYDRIDSSKGYTKDNIIVVSNRVNKIKSNASIDELKKITEFYIDI